jgi:hypothetical protein
VSASPGDALGQLAEQAPWLLLNQSLVLVGLGILAIGVAWWLLGRWLRRPKAGGVDHLTLESVDVSSLADHGPPDGAEGLTFYHVPVRLALLVLAPVGRDGQLPPSDQLPELVDQLVPGLMGVLRRDQPEFRRWPAQLSSEGFTKAFFSHLRLPGDRGKGTPWCSIAGKFETDQTQYLAGLVCRAAAGNSLSQVAIQHAGQWLDVLRVRS